MEPKNPPLPSPSHKATSIPNPDEHLPFSERAKWGIRERQLIASERIEGELSQLNYLMDALLQVAVAAASHYGIQTGVQSSSAPTAAGVQLSAAELAVVQAMRASQQQLKAPEPPPPPPPPPVAAEEPIVYAKPDMDGFRQAMESAGLGWPPKIGPVVPMPVPLPLKNR